MALTFNGSSDKIILPNNFMSTALPNKTIIVRFRSTASGTSHRCIFSEYNTGGTAHFFIGLNNGLNGRLEARWQGDSGSESIIRHDGGYADGKWHTLALVFFEEINTSYSRKSEIYIDSLLYTPDIETNDLTGITFTLNRQGVGCKVGATDTDFFLGDIDVVALYNQSIGMQDIIQLHEGNNNWYDVGELKWIYPLGVNTNRLFVSFDNTALQITGTSNPTMPYLFDNYGTELVSLETGGATPVTLFGDRVGRVYREPCNRVMFDEDDVGREHKIWVSESPSPYTNGNVEIALLTAPKNNRDNFTFHSIVIPNTPVSLEDPCVWDSHGKRWMVGENKDSGNNNLGGALESSIDNGYTWTLVNASWIDTTNVVNTPENVTGADDQDISSFTICTLTDGTPYQDEDGLFYMACEIRDGVNSRGNLALISFSQPGGSVTQHGVIVWNGKPGEWDSSFIVPDTFTYTGNRFEIMSHITNGSNGGTAKYVSDNIKYGWKRATPYKLSWRSYDNIGDTVDGSLLLFDDNNGTARLNRVKPIYKKVIGSPLQENKGTSFYIYNNIINSDIYIGENRDVEFIIKSSVAPDTTKLLVSLPTGIGLTIPCSIYHIGNDSWRIVGVVEFPIVGHYKVACDVSIGNTKRKSVVTLTANSP